MLYEKESWQKKEKHAIFLEKKSEEQGEDFEDKLAQLRVTEKSREIDGFREVHELKDQYKAKVIERAVQEGKDLKEITAMPANLQAEFEEKLHQIDEKYAVDGMYFLKCQFSKIIDDLRSGRRVEFEAFGPYLRDYIFQGLDSTDVEFTKTDKIGLAIMEFLRQEVMPEAHPVSLYDEYNMWTTASDKLGQPKDRDNDNPLYAKNSERGRAEVSDALKEKFKSFIERLFQERGIIKEGEEQGQDKDFVLVSESEKIVDAEELVKKLDEKGLIEYGDGEEIWFRNTIDKCEDPRYLKINLRDASGKWQCAGLDASGFINERNRDITHLVILPKENFEQQQDQVWEILRALDFRPEHYHNIFFETENPVVTAESAVTTLRSQIESLL